MNYEWIQRQAEVAAVKLGVASGQVWDLLVAKSRIDGAYELGVSAIGIFLIFAWYKGIKFAYKKCEEEKWAEIPTGPIGFVSALITIIGSFFVTNLISNFYPGLVHTLIPEYGALEFIRGILK